MSISITSDSKQQESKASGEKISMAEMPRKCKTSHVAPVMAQNACDSTREEEIIVRFTIAISAVQIVQVTKLISILDTL